MMECRRVKRAVQRWQTQENDILVSRKSKFPLLLNRANELLTSGRFNEVKIHGLGAAIARAIQLAQELERRSGGSLQLGVSTSTVTLVDDIYPANEDADVISEVRYNSAIHIRVVKVEGSAQPSQQTQAQPQAQQQQQDQSQEQEE